ncbi:MAG: UvrD/REP helicase [Candidatus Jorgensenbacteria bacterium GW2011_GWA2_45_13]|uniref:UvrD/REP helicase n=1 Tax=Candidatus Jorgensenbacteria bacterium GW2011_GWA2_45_13 TaxID=1618662 RepID=A0A0G1L5U7_9BACT|nr:MAG: UvrD/REP helicase [Candidatus Jorgensenbacteria bacterium GW2011_GWA2_45_13]
MSKDKKTFEAYYKQLNAAQKQAVDAVEGPVMVIAGPGTGKTQILTLRIANILRTTDTEPENILALTFTESGVASMRRRLVEIIGSPAYSVVINTFHGFCNDVIKGYPEEFPHIISAEHITEVDQIKLLEEIILKLPLKELKPFGDTFYYLRAVLSNVNELKREGVDPERFVFLVKEEKKAFLAISDLYHEKGQHVGKMKGEYQKLERRIAKNEELAKVYATYQEELARAKFYDYSDMIMEVLGALSRNKNLLLRTRSRRFFAFRARRLRIFSISRSCIRKRSLSPSKKTTVRHK